MNDLSNHVLSLAQNSPYPPSVGGQGLLYYSSLTSLWFMFMVAATMFSRIAKTTWTDRKYVKFNSAVNAWRMVIGLLMLVTMIRCGPEILYLLSFGDVHSSTIEKFLVFKRIMDTIAPIPFLAAISMLMLADEQISYHLKHPVMTATFDMTSRKEKLMDLFYLLGGVSLLAGIATLAKYVNFYHT